MPAPLGPSARARLAPACGLHLRFSLFAPERERNDKKHEKTIKRYNAKRTVRSVDRGGAGAQPAREGLGGDPSPGAPRASRVAGGAGAGRGRGGEAPCRRAPLVRPSCAPRAPRARAPSAGRWPSVGRSSPSRGAGVRGGAAKGRASVSLSGETMRKHPRSALRGEWTGKVGVPGDLSSPSRAEVRLHSQKPPQIQRTPESPLCFRHLNLEEELSCQG